MSFWMSKTQAFFHTVMVSELSIYAMATNYLIPNKRRSLSHRQRIFFLCGILFIVVIAAPSCKKKVMRPLTHPPKLALLAWGESGSSINNTLTRLEKTGWKIKFKDKQQIWLIIPPELDADTSIAALKQGLAEREAPALAELQLYLQNGKLILARLHRHDRVDRVEAYYANLQTDYGLKQAIWSAKPQILQDLTGNSFTKNIDLYETQGLFFAVHRSLLQEKAKSLQKGRNYRLEVVIYSKKANQGLDTTELIKRLQ